MVLVCICFRNHLSSSEKLACMVERNALWNMQLEHSTTAWPLFDALLSVGYLLVCIRAANMKRKSLATFDTDHPRAWPSLWKGDIHIEDDCTAARPFIGPRSDCHEHTYPDPLPRITANVHAKLPVGSHEAPKRHAICSYPLSQVISIVHRLSCVASLLLVSSRPETGPSTSL